MQRIVILGGGAGGAVAASRLAKLLKREKEKQEVQITLIDQNPHHEFRPSYLWVSMGIREPDQVQRSLTLLTRKGIDILNATITAINPEKQQVTTTRGTLDYDYLVISLGAQLRPDTIPGIENTYHAWELNDAYRLRQALTNFRGGKVVVGPVEPIYRCSPAPFELAFMIRYLAEQRGISEKTEITVIHPWQQPMEPFGPFMVNAFNLFLHQFNVRFLGGWQTTRITPGKIHAADGRELPYDLAIIIPPHEPAHPIKSHPTLTNPENGWLLVDKETLRHPEYNNIFGIGDIISPTLGIGMAGVFAHFQADYVASQITDEIKGTYMGLHYNRSGICVMDVGYLGAAVFCDFTDVIRGKAKYPRCWMLGGMRAFRGAKIAFERMWFAQLFGK